MPGGRWATRRDVAEQSLNDGDWPRSVPRWTGRRSGRVEVERLGEGRLVQQQEVEVCGAVVER